MPNESHIEHTFIEILTQRENQWKYRSDIKTEVALWSNLRCHINRINIKELDGEQLTDKEFIDLKNEFKRLTSTPFLASQWLCGENGVAKITIERENMSKGKVNLTLFSNKDIAGGISSYEVVNQIVPDCDTPLRSDVSLLINGLPLIHIELKTEYAKDGYYQAFDQIERYAKSGFFNNIYAAVQVFVISNKASTKYFARPSDNSNFNGSKKFLFNWRDEDNTPIEDLYEFTRKVLSIPAAHELISRYTILVDDKKSQKFMMVLRPYQIHAINKIRRQASAHEGGFIWHATGSGKTITSFVATKLLAQSAIGVARTIMIVDRKDLDSQTKNEFNKFASEYNTGQTSGDVTDNTLIVGIDNKGQLVDSIVSKKNNNTIIITTIQKLSYAIREIREPQKHVFSAEAKKKLEKNKVEFEKLKGEHIVFIVDECHRAVSDQEMREIKKFFPCSTWFGFTGTPIFEENKKQENGTYARTTSDQYGKAKDGTPLPNGGLLHAYTTKNAMDDKSVLDFQVEYHSLLNYEEEKRIYVSKIKQNFPDCNPTTKLDELSDYEKEALIDNDLYESDEYIEAMLLKIFRHQSVLEKFKIINGLPTMSGILTTHSIAQAKRIYAKLMDLKKSGMLITGNPLDERRRLNDPDFPRVAITYSLSEKQDEKVKASEELLGIMREYDVVFGTHYADGAKKVKKYNNGDEAETEIDDSNYNQNINNRLARKDAQYQKEGQWLDLVIVVDRLLTGFDAPTIQTLYVDRELRYHKLLQAFSRTNRNFQGKKIGMIVTFRKPKTMAKNVREAIKLFSNEARDWESLVPKEYKQVKKDFKSAYKKFEQAKQELTQDQNDLKKRLTAIKTFNILAKTAEAIRSYEEFEEEFAELSPALEVITSEIGHIENIKAEVKRQLEENDVSDEEQEQLLGIEFTAVGRATLEETIDSYYISQLLRDIGNEESKRKFDEIVESKSEIVKATYTEALNNTTDTTDVVESIGNHFKGVISAIISETADFLKVPVEELLTSWSEYSKDKDVIPYINEISNKTSYAKDEFESLTGRKFRKRRRYIEEYWRTVITEKLLPLKEEIVN